MICVGVPLCVLVCVCFSVCVFVQLSVGIAMFGCVGVFCVAVCECEKTRLC